MNKIAFTGIRNITSSEKSYTKSYQYFSLNTGKVCNEHTDCFELSLDCNLTDDTEGNHLSEFKEVLSKCRPCYQVNCIDKKQPDKFSLGLKYYKPDSQELDVIDTGSFFINGYSIDLDERPILPLFTYMAKITRQITNSKEASSSQKQKAEFINKTIEEKVMKFIDAGRI